MVLKTEIGIILISNLIARPVIIFRILLMLIIQEKKKYRFGKNLFFESNLYLKVVKDLHGETNLKPRRCVPDTKHIRSPKNCTETHFYINSEAPNSNLYSYSGTLILTEPEDHDVPQVTSRSLSISSTSPPERKWKAI